MTRSPSPLKSSQQAASGGGAADRGISVGMVSNPLSGGNKQGIDQIRSYLAHHPHIHAAEATTPGELNAVLDDFAVRGIDLLIVNGGDGTVQAVLTSLLGQPGATPPPLLALLRSGTTSMLARDVGARGEPLVALKKIHAWSMDRERDPSHIHERPVLRVSQEDHGESPCGMFFGAGAIPRGIDIFHSSMNPQGVRGELMPGLISLRLLLAALFGNVKLLPPTDMAIRLDETPTRRNSYLFAMVSTLERLFLGLHPFWGRERAPLSFTALKTTPPYLLRNLPFLLRGVPTATATEENGYFSHNASRITLDFRGPFTLDGEIFQARSPLTIEPVGPVRFLRI